MKPIKFLFIAVAAMGLALLFYGMTLNYNTFSLKDLAKTDLAKWDGVVEIGGQKGVTHSDLALTDVGIGFIMVNPEEVAKVNRNMYMTMVCDKTASMGLQNFTEDSADHRFLVSRGITKLIGFCAVAENNKKATVDAVRKQLQDEREKMVKSVAVENAKVQAEKDAKDKEYNDFLELEAANKRSIRRRVEVIDKLTVTEELKDKGYALAKENFDTVSACKTVECIQLADIEMTDAATTLLNNHVNNSK